MGNDLAERLYAEKLKSMVTVFDIKAIISSLRDGKATPEQQLDAASMLLLLSRCDSWAGAEDLYLTLKASRMIRQPAEPVERARPDPKTKPPPTPVPSAGTARHGV